MSEKPNDWYRYLPLTQSEAIKSGAILLGRAAVTQIVTREEEKFQEEVAHALRRLFADMGARLAHDPIPVMAVRFPPHLYDKFIAGIYPSRSPLHAHAKSNEGSPQGERSSPQSEAPKSNVDPGILNVQGGGDHHFPNKSLTLDFPNKSLTLDEKAFLDEIEKLDIPIDSEEAVDMLNEHYEAEAKRTDKDLMDAAVAEVDMPLLVIKGTVNEQALKDIRDAMSKRNGTVVDMSGSPSEYQYVETTHEDASSRTVKYRDVKLRMLKVYVKELHVAWYITTTNLPARYSLAFHVKVRDNENTAIIEQVNQLYYYYRVKPTH